MSNITPFTINYGMNNGFDLLWTNSSIESASSFPEQDIYIANFLSYNMLLVIVQNNTWDTGVTSCIASTKCMLKFVETAQARAVSGPGIAEPDPKPETYNVSIRSHTNLIRPISMTDTQTIHIGLCTTDEVIEYWSDDGEDVFTVNTSTDSVIPLYIYGIR